MIDLRPPHKFQILNFSMDSKGFTEWMKMSVWKISWFIFWLIYKDWFLIIKLIVNVINRPLMKLEHPQDLSFFYECRTFLHKKILSVDVRVLDLSSFLPPLLNNVGLKGMVKDVQIPPPSKIWKKSRRGGGSV